MGWVWLSLNPGSSVRPLRSITRVAGPTSSWISSLLPMRAMRLPTTATAAAVGWASSTVITVPFRKTRSADMNALRSRTPHPLHVAHRAQGLGDGIDRLVLLDDPPAG